MVDRLFCILAQIKKNKSSKLKKLEIFEQNKKLNNLNTLKNFGNKSKNHRDSLIKLINSIKGDVYGYGASARSSTLLNFAKLDHNKIKFIMDKNKLKNDLFTPGTKK